MTTSPTHTQVLRLIRSGDLCLDYHNRSIWFFLRDAGFEMSGPLVIRPDWKTGSDDRPGLMPIIQTIRDEATGFLAEGSKPPVQNVPDIYMALRERLSPAKLFYREDGQWTLDSFGSPPEC